MTILALIAAFLLALVHIAAGRLRFLYAGPRSRWFSVAGGVSVAYVFLHLLPELREGQEVIEGVSDQSFLERHVYLMALIGLATFYGVERLVKTRPKRNSEKSGQEQGHDSVFWVHVSSFAVYNFIIGYLLLHREESTFSSLFTFAVAMALHFWVNDYVLEEHHKEVYERRGRWILAAAVLLGWLAGYLTRVDEIWIVTLTSFVAGAIILNVLKEELPEERQSRFWSFALGAAAYASLLLLIG